MGNAVAVAEKELMTVEIPTDQGPVKLSPSIVRRYLVNGNGSVTDGEVMMFMSLCKFQGLNPFLREAYLIKYGNSAATIVTGKDAFLKRARNNPDFEGYRAGVIVISKDGEIKETEGFCPPEHTIVGGWAEVYVKSWKFPLKVEVDFAEYVGRKSDGSVTAMWQTKKATMIRKTALVQALREAFPAQFNGMYSEEEMNNVDSNELPRNAIDPEIIDVTEPKHIEKEQSNGNGAPTEQTQQRRRRANKFTGLDPALWDGKTELQTCGATPPQVLELRQLAKDQENRKVIMGYLSSIGYESVSFLREDEAKELIDKLSPIETAITHSDPVSEPAAASTPDDLVACPMNGGDKMSRSGYCLTECPIRRKDGFCPILGEAAPDGGLI